MKPRTIVKKAAFLIVYCVLLVGTAELLLTATRSVRKNELLQNFNQRNEIPFGLFDTEMIFRPNPLAADAWDSGGFRPMPSSQSASASASVVFLGDSFTWGEGLEASESYPAQISLMSSQSARTVRYVNAGIPGTSTDQQIVWLRKHILPQFHPDIVVWNINVNDLGVTGDNNQYCLFRVHKGKLQQVPGYLNSTFLKWTVFQRLPPALTSSKTVELLFNAIPERYTFGCSVRPDHSGHADRQVRQKTRLLAQHINELAHEYNFKLITVLVDSQPAYEDPVPDWYAATVDTYLSDLAELQPIPLAKEIRHALAPPADSPVLGSGTPSAELHRTLFLEDPVAPYGAKHMNRTGNELFARIVAASIDAQLQ